MNEITPTATKNTPQEGGVVSPRENSWLLAFKMLAFDIGVSTIIGFLYGIAVAITLIDNPDMAGNVMIYGGATLGTLVSIYVGYFLAKRTKDSRTLMHILTYITLYGIVGLATVDGAGTSLTVHALMYALTVAAYLIGWYTARATKCSVPLPGNTFFVVTTIIGYIVICLSILASVVTIVMR